MNGRAYDYNLGRFLSVDPFIQAPGNSQSMNPYSYIMNNPLSGTDPSGYLAEASGPEKCPLIRCQISAMTQGFTFAGDNGMIGHQLKREIMVGVASLLNKKDREGYDWIQDRKRNLNPVVVITQVTGSTEKTQSNDNPSTTDGVSIDSNRLGKVVEILGDSIIDFAKQLQDMANEVDKTSPEFIDGYAKGIESVPRGIIRAYEISADMLGMNGKDRQNMFNRRTIGFDLAFNQLLLNMRNSEQPGTDLINMIHRHHNMVLKSLNMVPIEKRAFVLGRFSGRYTAMRKLKSVPAWTSKLGDFYWGIVRSNAGIARVVEHHLLGEVIENLGVKLQ